LVLRGRLNSVQAADSSAFISPLLGIATVTATVWYKNGLSVQKESYCRLVMTGSTLHSATTITAQKMQQNTGCSLPNAADASCTVIISSVTTACYDATQQLQSLVTVQ